MNFNTEIIKYTPYISYSKMRHKGFLTITSALIASGLLIIQPNTTLQRIAQSDPLKELSDLVSVSEGMPHKLKSTNFPPKVTTLFYNTNPKHIHEIEVFRDGVLGGEFREARGIDDLVNHYLDLSRPRVPFSVRNPVEDVDKYALLERYREQKSLGELPPANVKKGVDLSKGITYYFVERPFSSNSSSGKQLGPLGKTFDSIDDWFISIREETNSKGHFFRINYNNRESIGKKPYETRRFSMADFDPNEEVGAIVIYSYQVESQIMKGGAIVEQFMGDNTPWFKRDKTYKAKDTDFINRYLGQEGKDLALTQRTLSLEHGK